MHVDGSTPHRMNPITTMGQRGFSGPRDKPMLELNKRNENPTIPLRCIRQVWFADHFHVYCQARDAHDGISATPSSPTLAPSSVGNPIENKRSLSRYVPSLTSRTGVDLLTPAYVVIVQYSASFGAL